MVKTSTRSRRGNDKTSPSKARGPNHCRVCPGRPLRAECQHTKSGRELLDKRKQQQTTPSKSPRASPKCTICDGRPLRSQCIHTAAGVAYLREQEILQELTTQASQQSESGVENASQPFFDSNEDSPTLLPDGSPSSATRPPSTVSAAANAGLSIPIDPFLLQLEGGQTEFGSSNGADGGNGGSISASSISATSKKSDYVRPTKSNPRYGWVKGAGRGSDEHKVFRRHPLPDVVTDQKMASKRFLEHVNRLLEKCEDLSNMTGCWLFLGAQHPSASGPTIHYTSSRLARDAPEPIGELLSDFHTLATQLLNSRRTDALVLQRHLREARERAQQFEEQNREMSEDNGVLAAKLDKMEQVLQTFAERLGVDRNAVSQMTS